MSFDIYLSYLYELSGYKGYVLSPAFMSNNAGVVSHTEKDGAPLFIHKNSGYEFSRVGDFAVVNLTGLEDKNACTQIPGSPFFIVNNNKFDSNGYIPTTDQVRYVLNALPRNSSYCTGKCLTETEFCRSEPECFYIPDESVVYWPLDAYIECAMRRRLPHGSEYVSLHKDRYVLLDRSKVIVDTPVSNAHSGVPVLGASAGRALSDAELGGIIGGSVGGVLLCCCIGYLCRRNRRGKGQ